MAIVDDTTAKPGETTPLIAKGTTEEKKFPKSVVYRALLAGFMVSLSFGVTQVP